MNLAQAAKRHPDRPALAFEGVRTTYAELDAEAARTGSSGVDVFVMPNTPGSVARFHGTLRKGGVVVPLNPLLSEAEIRARSVPFDPHPDTAVVLFTSGTTGEPKRIELDRATLERNADAVADALGFTEDDVLFGAAPLSHVFGMSGCMNAAIAAGACLALVPRFDARAALETIERERVTVFMGVPTMLSALVHASGETGIAPRMRLAHVGGAPLPAAVQQAFEERFGAVVLEGYGMTEVGGAIAVNRHDRERKPGSVGQAAAGQTLEIAEDGEVVVDGLRTGDVGRLDEDGYLYLLDRKKHVILRGGYTVYPREVENALCRHPGVREAAVIGVPDDALGQEVAAFVVGDVRPEELRDFARERLAAYKYPRHIEVLDELPRGPTGKLLREALALRARPPGPG
ncbi:MAG TPA: AMP-binding protein [Gaiellaceae bacterium]|nr:AMP-binding protein [Gaiellaceae bacterium]